MHQDTTAELLIVDDQAESLGLLKGLLEPLGYRVRGVRSGEDALRAARARRPDLILLDIRMPGRDGIETCADLKAEPETADVPVIFITGVDRPEEKERAFGAGGVDYVVKPFDARELAARVSTHLRNARLTAELERRNAELLELEELRDALVHMIVHDLRSPLSAILSSFQLLQMESGDLDEGRAGDLSRGIRSTRALMRMIDSLLDVVRMEEGVFSVDPSPVDVGQVLREAVDIVTPPRDVERVGIRDGAGELPTIRADRDVLARVVENLVGNALKFTPAPGRVQVGAAPTAHGVRVEVQDDGPGIPEEYRELVFEKFGQVQALQGGTRVSTGLGLTFCKMAVEAHGGTLGVESEVGRGSTFWFEIPAEPSAVG